MRSTSGGLCNSLMDREFILALDVIWAVLSPISGDEGRLPGLSPRNANDHESPIPGCLALTVTVGRRILPCVVRLIRPSGHAALETER